MVLGSVLVISNTRTPECQASLALAHMSACVISEGFLGKSQCPAVTQNMSQNRRQPQGNAENIQQILTHSS